MQKEVFEKIGLVLDKERVLTYSKLSCPLDCRYCFVEEMAHEQQRGVSYLSDEQFEMLGKPQRPRASLDIEQVQPNWMPEGNIFYKVERPGQMGSLIKVVNESQKKIFSGAAEANAFLKEHAEYRNQSKN